MKHLEPTTLAFLDSAPVRINTTVTLPGTPAAVFAELANAPEWTAWFPLMHRAAWLDGATGGLGAEREVAVRVLGSYRERMIAWDPGVRFAFTMTGTSSPLVRQMAEDYRLTGVAGGTRLDWTMAAAPSGIGRLGAPALRVIAQRLFLKAGQRLAERLRAGAGAAAVS